MSLLELAQQFADIVNDAADERPIQSYLAAHRVLLTPLGPLGTGFDVIDRPRLGAELVPDFLMSASNSAGRHWAAIELESPKERILTSAGRPARKLAEAMKQVRDWRAWLTDNVTYARGELALTGIDRDFQAYIIIGRRASISDALSRAYRELSDQRNQIMSYDRLIEVVTEYARNEQVNFG